MLGPNFSNKFPFLKVFLVHSKITKNFAYEPTSTHHYQSIFTHSLIPVTVCGFRQYSLKNPLFSAYTLPISQVPHRLFYCSHLVLPFQNIMLNHISSYKVFLQSGLFSLQCIPKIPPTFCGLIAHFFRSEHIYCSNVFCFISSVSEENSWLQIITSSSFWKRENKECGDEWIRGANTHFTQVTWMYTWIKYWRIFSSSSLSGQDLIFWRSYFRVVQTSSEVPFIPSLQPLYQVFYPVPLSSEIFLTIG